MAKRKREGNRPDRRIAPADFLSRSERQKLARRIVYAGSGTHKLKPGNYGFVPTHNPRPSKSVCDDIKDILLEDARKLFSDGIAKGMVSRFESGQTPKYVWAVDDDGEVYEAKIGSKAEYHGYRLSDDDRQMRDYVRREWERR